MMILVKCIGNLFSLNSTLNGIFKCLILTTFLTKLWMTWLICRKLLLSLLVLTLHRCIILPREKKPGAYLVKFTLKNTLELSTPTDTPPKEGDQALLNIFTLKKEGGKNEFGQGQLKMLLTPIAQRMGLNRVGDILEAIKLTVLKLLLLLAFRSLRTRSIKMQ
jgi:hypothetical protein